MTVEVRRAGDRFRTVRDGVESRHSFSFGEHYDPANLGFGLLVAHNEDVVAAGRGYETHPHRDLEILTWVLGGRLRHTDSGGTSGIVYPGLAQRLSAGSGILHAERTDGDEPVHFVQMWVRPDEPGLSPGYAQHDVSADLASGELVPVASGTRSDAAIRINQPAGDFFVARLRPGTPVSLPGAAYTHLFVAQGTAELDGAGELGAGDAARITDNGGLRVTGDAEVLVWTFAG